MKPNAKGWWYHATDEQRLAQIDGAIECGMTQAQVAINCGANSQGAISMFTSRHGRSFGEANRRSSKLVSASRERMRIMRSKKSGNMTNDHFNIFALGVASKASGDFDELEF